MADHINGLLAATYKFHTAKAGIMSPKILDTCSLTKKPKLRK